MMTHILKSLTITGAIMLILSVLINSALANLGIYFNVSGSLPLGFYRQSTSQIPQKGALALACLDDDKAAFAFERGYLGIGSCRNNIAPVGKFILASGGDFVEIGPEGILVNHSLIPNTRPSLTDGSGLPLPQITLRRFLAEGEFILGNPKLDSYDSRYFGVVDGAQINSLIEAVNFNFDSKEALQ